jgi:hypothetical protein
VDHHRYELWDAIGRGLTDPEAARAFQARLIVTDSNAPRYQELERRLRKAESERRAALRQASSGIEIWELLHP